ARTRRQTTASSPAAAGGKESSSTAVLCACPSPDQTMCRRYSWAAARCTAASGQPRGESNFVVTWCSIVVHRGHDRFAGVGRDRFIGCWMVGASVAFSPKPSAKAPPQEPCPGSKAAKARGRQLARRRWQRRKGLVAEVARQAQDEGVYGTCPGGTPTWTTLLSY